MSESRPLLGPRMAPAMAGTMLLIFAAGLALRLPHLAGRPMHADEAVQAAKLGELLARGVYIYNPREFHGPVLYNFTVPILSAAGIRDWKEIPDAAWLRIVPVLFGIGLIPLLLLIRPALGNRATLMAALCIALSPAFVFYSRYYIQEMPLAFLTLLGIGAAWRWLNTGRVRWLLIAALALGLMMAAKETWAILVFAALPAAWLAQPPERRWRWSSRAAAYGIGAFILALAVAILLLTNFLNHPAAALDFVRAFGGGAARAISGDSGTGDPAAHRHPWPFYLRMLAFYRDAPGPWWSEGAILALGAIGIGRTLFAKAPIVPLVRFFAIDALFLLFVFSAIPYKTPWLILNILLPWCVMAGVGADGLLALASRPMRFFATAAILAGVATLGVQSWRATHFYEQDERNPYAYSLTSSSYLQLIDRIEELARIAPAGRGMLIQAIAPRADYWPLPWDLRRYPKVGFWSAIPSDPDADIVIVAEPLADALRAKLKQDYEEEIYGLRPRVLLDVEIRRDLWNAMMQKRNGGSADGR